MSDAGRSVSSKGKVALVLGLLSATLGLSAQAQDKPILFEGIYRIAIESTGIAPPAGECLINNGQGSYERYLWPLGGPARWCGFSTLSEMLQNGQAEFGIKYVTGPLYQEQYVIFPRDDQNACLIAHPDGTTGVAPCAQAELTSDGRWFIDSTALVGSQRFASIRSATDDRCLIFGSDGQDVRPTLHRWTHDTSDQLYCGLGVDELMETGQGLFTFLRVAYPN